MFVYDVIRKIYHSPFHPSGIQWMEKSWFLCCCWSSFSFLFILLFIGLTLQWTEFFQCVCVCVWIDSFWYFLCIFYFRWLIFFLLLFSQFNATECILLRLKNWFYRGKRKKVVVAAFVLDVVGCWCCCCCCS